MVTIVNFRARETWVQVSALCLSFVTLSNLFNIYKPCVIELISVLHRILRKIKMIIHQKLIVFLNCETSTKQGIYFINCKDNIKWNKASSHA
jgi:hypothetical protein